MLIRYKKNLEKIAMGLLSFMPTVKDVKTLQDIIKQYETDPNWHLYLWKDDDDMIGVIGLKVNEEEKQAIIQHLSVSPSHRNQGVGKLLISEIHQQYDQYQLCAEEVIDGFYKKCDLENDSHSK